MITKRLRCPVYHAVIYYEEITKPHPKVMAAIKKYNWQKEALFKKWHTSGLFINNDFIYTKCPQCKTVLAIHGDRVRKALKIERRYFEERMKVVAWSKSGLYGMRTEYATAANVWRYRTWDGKS